MSTTYFRTAALAVAGLMFIATPSFADHNRGDRGRNDRGRQSVNRGPVVGRAAPRVYTQRYVAPHYIRPRVVRVVPYRPYYYAYRPGFSFNFAYGSPYYGYPAYSPYAYPTPPAGYLSAIPGRAYGGVRIEDAPQDGQVFADGYYMGVVDDFDNPFQHMNLEAGPHKIEIRAPGFEPVAFDVNVVPGETITYHADMLELRGN
jgi:PEGA domain